METQEVQVLQNRPMIQEGQHKQLIAQLAPQVTDA